MLEEIEFHRLAKLRLEVDEPEELYVQIQKLKVNVYLVDAGIHTADFLHMISPTTVLPQKRRNLCSW
jgi:hypothetical protein